MRLLADENVARVVVLALRRRAHDVTWVREASPGASDEQVLAMAHAEHRTLVTFDKDFGELAFSRGLPASCGVILFRFAVPSPGGIADTIARVVESRADWAGYFSVIEPDRIRMTALRRRSPSDASCALRQPRASAA